MLADLKKILTNRKMTQLELAKRTGISIATIGNYAAGRGNPTLKHILSICDTLSCTVNDLTGKKAIEYDQDGPHDRSGDVLSQIQSALALYTVGKESAGEENGPDYGKLRKGDWWLMSVGSVAILLIAWGMLITLMTLGE